MYFYFSILDKLLASSACQSNVDYYASKTKDLTVGRSREGLGLLSIPLFNRIMMINSPDWTIYVFVSKYPGYIFRNSSFYLYIVDMI